MSNYMIPTFLVNPMTNPHGSNVQNCDAVYTTPPLLLFGPILADRGTA